MNNQQQLETERLYLRPVTIEDASDIYEYSKDQNVGPNAGWEPHKTMDDTLKIIKLIFLDQKNIFGIVLKESGKLIGTLGLIDDPKRQNDRVKMLGYAIGARYWGKGYMTEAAKAVVNYGFEVLDLHLISAYCFPFNDRSKRVLAKLGFIHEGTLSLCEQQYNGEVYDNECYALIRK